MQSYEKLEQEYARHVGTFEAVACNTGTASLHLALAGLGIGPGDEVIVPEFTMIASAWAVTYTGATPVFVDCGDDLLIDVNKISRAITPKTKAIMVTHVYGRVCDMRRIIDIAKSHRLRIIEDCCEAQEARINGRHVGSFDIGCFSFYQNKILPAEEGGIITTDDAELAKKCRDLRSMAFGESHDYLHKTLGFNYRMTNSQASYASTSIRMASGILLNRRLIEELYDRHLNPRFRMPARDTVWVYDIRHPNMEEVVRRLNEKGHKARHGFKPMSMQPMYRKDGYESLNAYKKSREVCYLPVYLGLDEKTVQEICAIIDSVK